MGIVEDCRFYKIPAKGQPLYLPSVTTILDVIDKPFLRFWYGSVGGKVAQETSEYALQAGSDAHHLIYEINDKGQVEPSSWNASLREAKTATKAFLNFRAHWHFDVVLQEWTVYDERIGYAGTMDALGTVDVPSFAPQSMRLLKGKRLLLLHDWKTSKKITLDAELQLAAYAYASRNDTGRRIEGAAVVRLNKDPKLEKSPESQYEVRFLTLSQLKTRFKVFRHVFEVWKYINSDLVRKVNENPDIIIEEEIDQRTLI